jgi:glycine/D-amino acid oxidase-like deaminating enzyme
MRHDFDALGGAERLTDIADDLAVEDGDTRRLRSGRSPWSIGQFPLPHRPLAEDCRVDVVVVGAGITGSLAAEALTAAGASVMVIDRALPGRGSTAASTAMLQWELDSSLTELSDLYGFERAARIYRRSHAAAADLARLAAGLRIDCGFTARATLYLTGGETGPGTLTAEHEARERAGLPGALLDAETLADRFALHRPAALVSPGSAEADPVRLSLGVLRTALARGAILVEDEVVAYDAGPRAVHLALASGRQVEAGHVVLATGYAMPPFVTSDLHQVVSSWCLATEPQDPADLWPGRCLIWEASEPYLYARTTADGRIVAGGEDEETDDAADRERKMAEKTERIRAKLKALWPHGHDRLSHAWSAEFGETTDGLPLIGAVPGAPRILAAYGYGGNGITYSYMASRMLAAEIAGERRDWFDDFALDRPAPAA